jgi:hypothetical protein
MVKAYSSTQTERKGFEIPNFRRRCSSDARGFQLFACYVCPSTWTSIDELIPVPEKPGVVLCIGVNRTRMSEQSHFLDRSCLQPPPWAILEWCVELKNPFRGYIVFETSSEEQGLNSVSSCHINHQLNGRTQRLCTRYIDIGSCI